MEYVWVAGISRVGKSTLIRKLVEDQELRAALHMPGKAVAHGPSNEYPPAPFSVADLVREGDALDADYLLVKWQFRHADDGYVRQVRHQRPQHQHSLLVLVGAAAEILERWRESERPYIRGKGQLEGELRTLKTHLAPVLSNAVPIGLRFVEVSGTQYRLVEAPAYFRE